MYQTLGKLALRRALIGFKSDPAKTPAITLGVIKYNEEHNQFHFRAEMDNVNIITDLHLTIAPAGKHLNLVSSFAIMDKNRVLGLHTSVLVTMKKQPFEVGQSLLRCAEFVAAHATAMGLTPFTGGDYGEWLAEMMGKAAQLVEG